MDNTNKVIDIKKMTNTIEDTKIPSNTTNDRKIGFADGVFAIFLFIMGYMYQVLIGFSGFGMGVTVFTLVLIIGIAIYFAAKKVKFKVEAFIYLLIALIGTLFFGISSSYIKIVMFIVVDLSLAIWIAHSNDKLIDNKVNENFIADCVNLFILMPFINFFKIFECLKFGFGKGKKSKDAIYVLIGTIIMIPVLVIVCSLLMSYDEGFKEFMTVILEAIDIDFWIFFKVIIAIVLGAFLGGFIFGCVHGNNKYLIKKQPNSNGLKDLKFMPRAIVYGALASINFIYILFLISQIIRLVKVLYEDLPLEFTYSDYAREGFLQMCIVIFINLVVILCAHVFIKTDNVEKKSKRDSGIHGALRVLSVILCLFTMFFIVLAIIRLFIYIDNYGLTYLRINSLIFITAAVVMLFFAIIRHFVNYNISRILLVFTLIFVTGVAYANVDGIIANYNISKYIQECELNDPYFPEIDMDTLEELGDGAAPYIYNLYYSDYANEDMKLELAAILADEYRGSFLDDKDLTDADFSYEEDEGFRDYNFETAKKRKLRNEILLEEYDNEYLLEHAGGYEFPIGDICIERAAFEDWEDLYIYVYFEDEYGTVVENSNWPGELMVDYQEDVYFYDVDDLTEHYFYDEDVEMYVIFNNGLGGEDGKYPARTGLRYEEGDYKILTKDLEWEDNRPTKKD